MRSVFFRRRTSGRTGALVGLLLGLIGCHSTAGQPTRNPKERHMSSPSSAAPAKARGKSDLVAHDGEIIRAVGVYRVRDIGPYKTGEIGSDGNVRMSRREAGLVLEDGTWVNLPMQRTEDLDRLAGKSVVVTARIVVSPPTAPSNVAQRRPTPTLVDVAVIAEAEQ